MFPCWPQTGYSFCLSHFSDWWKRNNIQQLSVCCPVTAWATSSLALPALRLGHGSCKLFPCCSFSHLLPWGGPLQRIYITFFPAIPRETTDHCLMSLLIGLSPFLPPRNTRKLERVRGTWPCYVELCSCSFPIIQLLNLYLIICFLFLLVIRSVLFFYFFSDQYFKN